MVLAGCGGSRSRTISSGDAETTTLDTAPTGTTTPVPAGHIRVNYGNASIVVPNKWQIFQPGVTTCDSSPIENVVLLGNAALGGPSCGSGASRASTSFAHLQGLPARTPNGPHRTINGQAAIVLAAPASGIATYAIPALGVELEVEGAQAASIVPSLGWSSRYLALHPQTPVTIPQGWGTATYDGVTIRLPRTWPLTKVGPAQGEPGCGADFSSPQLLEGPVFGHTCGLSLGPAPLSDGVWLQGPSGMNEAELAGPGYTSLRTTPTRVFLDDSQDPMGVNPLLHLLAIGRGGAVDAIDVGLGPNPDVAAAIIASITAATGSRNVTSNPTAPPAPSTATTVTTPPRPTVTSQPPVATT